MMKKTDDQNINISSKELENLKIEVEAWKAKYIRALADYQNLEKRIQTLRADELKLASKKIIEKILPVLDNLEKAQIAKNDEGLSLVIKLFKNVLDNEQVKKIEVAGKRFDPLYMECVEVEGDGKDDIVLEEVRPGYMIHDQILRVAQVKVGKKKTDNKEQITDNKNIV